MTTAAPEAVLERALAYKARLQYDGVVALCDPESLLRWFADYCDNLRPRTASEVRAGHSHIPDEKQQALHEYFLERAAKAHSSIPRRVPGTATYAELLALSPSEFARRRLEADDMRCKIIRALDKRGEPVPAAMYDPPQGWGFRATHSEILSDSEVRVFYTELYEGTETAGDTPEYEEVRRLASGDWLLVARDEVLQTRGSMSTTIAQELHDLIADEL